MADRMLLFQMSATYIGRVHCVCIRKTIQSTRTGTELVTTEYTLVYTYYVHDIVTHIEISHSAKDEKRRPKKKHTVSKIERQIRHSPYCLSVIEYTNNFITFINK